MRSICSIGAAPAPAGDLVASPWRFARRLLAARAAHAPGIAAGGRMSPAVPLYYQAAETGRPTTRLRRGPFRVRPSGDDAQHPPRCGQSCPPEGRPQRWVTSVTAACICPTTSVPRRWAAPLGNRHRDRARSARGPGWPGVPSALCLNTALQAVGPGARAGPGVGSASPRRSASG